MRGIALEHLGPALLVDTGGHVIDSNERGRRWLRDDGGAPIAPDELAATGRASRWLHRREPTTGAVERALMTIVPQPDGHTLLLLADDVHDPQGPDVHVRAVLDSMPAMIGYWSRELLNGFGNRAYVEWFGMTPEQLRGRHIRDLLGPEIYGKNLPHIEGALRGEVQRFERSIPRPDGSGVRHSDATYVPDIVDGAVVGFSVLVADVTKLKNAESALRAAHAELEARVAERTAAITQANLELSRSNAELAQFAHIASHDLQEPLRTIVSYCELLHERYGGQLDERAARYIRYAVQAARRMQALVRALLAVAQVGGSSATLAPIDPAEAARAALAGLQLLVEEAGAEVVIEPLPPVLSDPHELAEVFQNLISNAIKFRGADPPRITIGARDAGDLVELTVADNGIGIAEEHVEKIFNMFHRAHASAKYTGSGIGLAFVRKLVERQGGTVGVRSILGRGATFWFTLRKPPLESSR